MAAGTRTSVNQMAAVICRVMGKDIESIHEEARAGDVRDSQGDATRAREILGWDSVMSIEEGMVKTVEYFMNEEDGGGSSA